MLRCAAQNDLPGYYECNQQIHARINLAARNSVLHQTFLGINRRLQALRFRSNLKPGKWDSAVRDHVAMIEARDGDRLARILSQHLLDKRAAIMAMVGGDASPR